MDWEGFFTHYRKPGFIPGYEIVNKLGSGVFGEVYKARKESIGKFYAIKFLKVSDEKISEAIFKELDTLRYFAQIDHPNLVSIEDQGEVMGIPYIVMGYGGDQTLKKRLQSGRLAPDLVVSLFRQISEGVAALHAKSIIHFDLKPANIFMKGDHARVGDYGLSKLVSESHNTMSIGRGTPYYMAPEMLRRRGDHLSDIYSLGVILYEMLTGEVPFKGDSEWEVLRKHESEPVPMPTDLSEPYRSMISRAMQKEPASRFQSVREILEVLDGGSAQPGSFAIPVPLPGAGPSGSAPPPLPPRSTREIAGEVKERLGQVVDNLKEVGGVAAERAKRAYRDKLEKVTDGVKEAKGTAAERAKKVYKDKLEARRQVSPPPLVDADGSFYADFDALEASTATEEYVEPVHLPGKKSRKAAAKVKPRQDGESGTEIASEPKTRGFFGWIFWTIALPFRLLFKALGAVFHNFFRYLVIATLTVGLAFLIHGLIWGWEFGF